MSQERARTGAEVLAFTEALIDGETNTNEDVLKKYDEWADVYDQDVSAEGVNYFGPRWLAETVSHLLSDRKGARILDLGAGTGLTGELLKTDGFTNIDALDGSAKMLEKAKSKKVYKKLIQAIIGPKPLDIADSAYDAVISMGTFCGNHVPASCFSDLIRITKPGGHCILSLWEGDMEIYGSELDRLVSEGKWSMKEKKTEDKLYGSWKFHLFTMQTHK